jgi:hypothetical protein
MTEDFIAAGLRLSRRDRAAERRVVQAPNPFVVATTTKAVIDGHNGIWALNFRIWLGEVIAALERRNEQKRSPLSLKPQAAVLVNMTTSVQTSGETS